MPKTKPSITEAQAEKMVDQMVWKRLQHDSAYMNAESNEAAQDRENVIAAAAWEEITLKYNVG